MKKNKILKALGLFAGAILLVAVSIAGTVAYLTSTDSVTNTFTVGKINISMDESPVDLYGAVVSGNRVKTNQYKLIPSHEYVKDPVITVKADSEKCYLFVKVENGIAAIEAADNKIADQLTTNTWTALNGQTGVYYKVIETSNADQEVPVFGSFKLATDANVAGYADAKINITAYAIQFDGLADASAAWTAVSTASTNP